MVVLARVDEPGSGFLFDGSTFDGKTRAQVEAGNWQVGVQAGAAAFSSSDPVTVTATLHGWQVHAFLFAEAGGSTTVSHYIEGGLVGSHSVAEDVSLGGLILGNNGANDDGLDCEIAEVVIYDRLLRLSETGV